MNDETKAAADAALVESMVQQLRDCVSVGDEMTLDHASLLDDAADWIAGEPARLAAAREEQREADVRSCPTCKGEGFTMRVRECPFCDDSTHDHECPTDEVKVYCACGAAHIRATPLTATPLEDENKVLGAERDAALGRVKDLEVRVAAKDDYGLRMDALAEHRLSQAHQAETRRDAALARVKELEVRAGEWADAQRVFLTSEAECDALKARVKELEENSPEAAKYWRREYHEEYARRVAVEDLSRTTCDRYLTDIGPTEHVLCCDKESSRRVVALVEERDALKAQLAEAMEGVELLRAIRRRAKTPRPGRWVDNVFHPQLSEDEVRAKAAEIAAADAFLAKVKP